MVTHAQIETGLLGTLTVTREDRTLLGIYFPGHWTLPPPEAFGPFDGEGLEPLRSQLEEYLSGRRTVFDLPQEPRGTPFFRKVWEGIAAIPYGQTSTYGALARRVGPRVSPRAVGTAVGRNPLSILIPCHRVIGSDGRLTGYAGGLERKRALLALEGALLPGLSAREQPPGPGLQAAD